MYSSVKLPYPPPEASLFVTVNCGDPVTVTASSKVISTSICALASFAVKSVFAVVPTTNLVLVIVGALNPVVDEEPARPPIATRTSGSAFALPLP